MAVSIPDAIPEHEDVLNDPNSSIARDAKDDVVTYHWRSNPAWLEFCAALQIAWPVVGMGLISALDTLAAQAYGAGNFMRVGIVLQRGVLVLGVTCVPVAIFWISCEPLLLLARQDPEIASLAGRFVLLLLPGLPMYFLFDLLKRYLQAQSRVREPMLVSILGVGFSVLYNSVLVYGMELGLTGAAVAITLTHWTQALLMLATISWRQLHVRTWSPWSKEAFTGWREFLGLGVPGAAMVCAEWWGFEVHALLAGVQGTTQLASQTVLLNTMTLAFMLPFGISIASSVRVGNFLGADEPAKAKLSARVSMITAGAGGLLIGIVFLALHTVWAYVFTSDENVVSLVATVMPIACAFMVTDALQAVASGVFRGCGRQKLGAAINLGGYWLLALPLAALFAFPGDMGLAGQWAGLMIGSIVIASVALVIISRTDWQAQAGMTVRREAAERRRATLKAEELALEADGGRAVELSSDSEHQV